MFKNGYASSTYQSQKVTFEKNTLNPNMKKKYMLDHFLFLKEKQKFFKNFKLDFTTPFNLDGIGQSHLSDHYAIEITYDP
jgi:hypothetical protein